MLSATEGLFSVGEALCSVPDADSCLVFLQPAVQMTRVETATTKQERRANMAVDGLPIARAVEQIVGPLIKLGVQVIVEPFEFNKLGRSTERADQRATAPIRSVPIGS